MSNKVLKVKPWGEGQGEFVVIEESEFNPDFHNLVDGETAPCRALIVGAESSSVDIDKFRAELEAIGLIVESFNAQELARPDGELGPVADHLFQVFEAVNAGVESLVRERDGEVEKAQSLQLKLDELVAQTAQGRQVSDEEREVKEVAELKAKLDAAKVTYRSNASKESLQKQVDELSKA